VARDYADLVLYPCMAGKITGIPREDVIRVARNLRTMRRRPGKINDLLGPAQHWYHSDMIYRTIINLTTLCVARASAAAAGPTMLGKREVRPWPLRTVSLDWTGRPPRHITDVFFYFATDQWRYESFDPAQMSLPLRHDSFDPVADYKCGCSRLWGLPSYPSLIKTSQPLPGSLTGSRL